MVTTESRICDEIASIVRIFMSPIAFVISRPMKMFRVMGILSTSTESWKIVSMPRLSVTLRDRFVTRSPFHR